MEMLCQFLTRRYPLETLLLLFQKVNASKNTLWKKDVINVQWQANKKQINLFMFFGKRPIVVGGFIV